jgi:hypothetical protein
MAGRICHFRPWAVLCAVVLVLLALASPVTARGTVLSKAEARKLAVGTAQQVRRDLESEGAQRAGVAGCWRHSARRVSCYLKVSGYDTELDFRWTCMLRMTVELRPQRDGARRFKSRYTDPVCG